MKKNPHMIPKGAKISNENKEKLITHAKNHGKSHIASMRRNILMGKTFEEAHKEAKKKGFK